MKGTTKVITATEFKKNLGSYIDFVSENNEIVLTKNGHKALRLSPYITDIEQYFMVKENALDDQYGGKKISYEEFKEIYRNTEQRMEYINGEIILLSSPSAFHQGIAGNIYVKLRDYLQGKACKVFFAPFDVHLYKHDVDTPDVLQPDLLIACDLEGKINEKGKYLGTPALCVEIVSDHTRSRDMVDKLNTYMLSGVKEYWIVDSQKQTVIIYTFNDYEINEYATFKDEERLSSNHFAGIEIPLDEIFAQ